MQSLPKIALNSAKGVLVNYFISFGELYNEVCCPLGWICRAFTRLSYAGPLYLRW